MSQSFQRTAICCAITVLVAACGGGRGGDSSASSTTSLISGSVDKGPVANAQVCFYELVSTGKGNLIGCTNTSSDGTYTARLNYTGPIYTEASNGTYTDETTGLNTSLNTTLVSVAGIVGGTNTTIVATPLTTMAAVQAAENGGLTLSSYNTKSAQIGEAFGINTSLTSTRPNISLASSDPYGAALKAVSKLMHSGVSLSNITQTSTTNITNLQQRSNIAAQCIVANDPNNSNSTTLLGGTYYTNVAITPTYVSSVSNSILSSYNGGSNFSYNMTIYNGTISNGGNTSYNETIINGGNISYNGTIINGDGNANITIYNGTLNVSHITTFTNITINNSNGHATFNIIKANLSSGLNPIPIDSNNTYAINSQATGSAFVESILYSALYNANFTDYVNTSSIISAKEPDPKWRNLVTAAGSMPMGCALVKNTPAEVVLNCSANNLISGNLSLYSGTWINALPSANMTSLPTSGLLVKAKRIEISGNSVGPLKIQFNNTCQANLIAQNLTPPTSN